MMEGRVEIQRRQSTSIRLGFVCVCNPQFGLRCPSRWRRQWHPTPVLLPGKSHGLRSLIGYSPGVAKSQTRLSDFPFTFHFHALEKEMATHSSALAWKIPGTGEPGGLLSMGSHRVRHDWSDLAAAATAANGEESGCRKPRFTARHQNNSFPFLLFKTFYWSISKV